MAIRAGFNFQLTSPTTRILFEAGLHNNPPPKDYNFFRKHGLIGPATPGRDFESAIGKFGHLQNAGQIKFYTRGFKRGEPQIGDRINLRDNADMPDRPFDVLSCVVFTSDPELVGTEYENAITPTATYADLQVRIRDYFDNCECEEIFFHAAGGRGDNDAYEVFSSTQADIDDADTLPLSLQHISSVNKIEKPSRHIAAWQTPATFGQTIDYGTTTQGMSFDFFADMVMWLGKRSRVRDGYNFESAQVQLPSYMKDKKATQMMPEMLHLIVSKEVMNRWKKTSEWKEYQRALATAYGLEQGLGTGLGGMIHGVNVQECDLVPRFTKSGKRFCAGLIFGKMAMIMGYHNRRIPMRYRAVKSGGTSRTMHLQVPYQSYVYPVQKGMDSEIFCRKMYGIKQMRFRKPNDINFANVANPGQGKDTVSRGMARVDIQE